MKEKISWTSVDVAAQASGTLENVTAAKFLNTGSAAATVNGASLPQGESVCFDYHPHQVFDIAYSTPMLGGLRIDYKTS